MKAAEKAAAERAAAAKAAAEKAPAEKAAAAKAAVEKLFAETAAAEKTVEEKAATDPEAAEEWLERSYKALDSASGVFADNEGVWVAAVDVAARSGAHCLAAGAGQPQRTRVAAGTATFNRER